MSFSVPWRLDVIEDLTESLQSAYLCLPFAGFSEVERMRKAVLAQLKARALVEARGEKPVYLIVLGGPSGAGRSSVFGLLAGDDISPVGIIRPTTTSLIAAAHPNTIPKIADHPLAEIWQIYPSNVVPEDVVLVDTPDLSINEQSNGIKVEYEIAEIIIDVADLWVFVTTANRYGDLRSWQNVLHAYESGVSVAVVLNRIPAGNTVVAPDLLQRMQQIGLGQARVLVVEQHVSGKIAPSVKPKVETIIHECRRISASPITAMDVKRWPILQQRIYDVASAIDMQKQMIIEMFEAVRIAAEKARDYMRTVLTTAGIDSGAPRASWIAITCAGGPFVEMAAGVWSTKGIKAGDDVYAVELYAAVEQLIFPLVANSWRSAKKYVIDKWQAMGLSFDLEIRQRIFFESDVTQQVKHLFENWDLELRQLLKDRLANLSINTGILDTDTYMNMIVSLGKASVVGLSSLEEVIKQAADSHFVAACKEKLLTVCASTIQENLQNRTEKYLASIGYKDDAQLRSMGLKLRALEIS